MPPTDRPPATAAEARIAKALAAVPKPEPDDNASMVCAGCGNFVVIRDGYEEPSHRLCWPCATATLEKVIAVLRGT